MKDSIKDLVLYNDDIKFTIKCWIDSTLLILSFYILIIILKKKILWREKIQSVSTFLVATSIVMHSLALYFLSDWTSLIPRSETAGLWLATKASDLIADMLLRVGIVGWLVTILHRSKVIGV